MDRASSYERQEQEASADQRPDAAPRPDIAARPAADTIPRDLRPPLLPNRPDEGDRPDETKRQRGAVDSSGYRTIDRDLGYCDVTPEALRNLQRGDAPLGLSPDQYREMRADLDDALERDGLGDADVRLQGSAATFYSRNPDKAFFADIDAVRAHCDKTRSEGYDVDPQVEEAAVRRYSDAGYTDGPKPRDKMFDQDHTVTHLPHDRSDYDIQISSNTLQTKMEQYRQEHPGEKLISDHGGHWKDKSVRDAFPVLDDWATKWTERTGRDVAVAGFGASGPGDESAFSDDDWIIRGGDTP